MKIIEDINNCGEIEAGSAISIGNFDGVHLGHQEIISKTREAAKKCNGRSAIMTFHPHPVAILHPERTPGMLTPIEVKKHILAALGVDYLIVIRDSYKLLNLSPEQFVDDFLMEHISPAVVVEGDNFHFGYGRSGNIKTLCELGRKSGFDVMAVEQKTVEFASGQRVVCSSSLIRELLEKGEVATAGKMLTRPYRLIGQVKQGRGVGAELGFPTANLEPTNQIIPAEGVYAGFVSVGDDFDGVITNEQKLPVAISIGRAKTFLTEHPLMIEAHILADVGDLYGKYLGMDFIEKLRNQQRFESEDKLKQQIKKDCEKASLVLSCD